MIYDHLHLIASWSSSSKANDKANDKTEQMVLRNFGPGGKKVSVPVPNGMTQEKVLAPLNP